MLTVSTRWFLDRKHVIKKVGEGRAKALRKAGALVYRSVQKEFARGTPTSRGTVRPVGEWRGLPLMEQRKRVPKNGRITSWRSRRSANGFMRTSVAFAYDSVNGSVVVGPRYSPWLNRLHEFGGSQTQRLYIRNRGRAVPLQRVYSLRRTGARSNLAYIGSFVHPRSRQPSFVATSRTRTVRVKASRYQRNGLQKVLAKIPKQFKDQISGP